MFKFNIGVIPVILIFFILIMLEGCAVKQSMQYGVFLGIDEKDSYKLNDYKIVVIEPSEFGKKQISKLQKTGKTVYGYLNIGAIEEYRPYYEEFGEITLGIYDDWQDERWIDASSKEWQKFVVDLLARDYTEKGLDGFFIDNTDVYYEFQNDSIFTGLCRILEGLKGYEKTVIINGGDSFVLRCMEEGTALSLFDGINQETVFTRIDFSNKTYHVQHEEETEYFTDYISRAKEYGLSVFLLEYGADPELTAKIDNYCNVNGFLWYNASGLELMK